MNETRIGFKPDLVARPELVSFAKHRDDFLAAEFGDDLGLRARRLDDLHLRFGPVVGDDEMLRADAVTVGRPSDPLGADEIGSRTPPGPSNSALPLSRNLPFRKFIAGEPMKPATNRLLGRS